MKLAEQIKHPFGKFWSFLAEITGVAENHCRIKHSAFHKPSQIQYNGMVVVHCSKCNRSFYRH